MKSPTIPETWPARLGSGNFVRQRTAARRQDSHSPTVMSDLHSAVFDIDGSLTDEDLVDGECYRRAICAECSGFRRNNPIGPTSIGRAALHRSVKTRADGLRCAVARYTRGLRHATREADVRSSETMALEIAQPEQRASASSASAPRTQSHACRFESPE